MQYVRELWLWLGEHQTAAIVVIVGVFVLVVLRQLGEMVGQ